MSRLHIDIEAFSSVDLKRFGVYAYTASPDFQVLMAAWSLDGSPTRVVTDPEEIAAIPGLLDPEVLKVAHNAQFERVALSRFFGLGEGEFLPPEEWHDSMAVAAQKGWPQNLGMLAKALDVEEHKDEAGTRLINLFCKPNRKGARTLPEERPMEWLDFVVYCWQDVETLIAVDRALGDHVTPVEREIYLADQHVNDAGIAIDVPMARVAEVVAEENQGRQKETISVISGVVNPNSQPQMMAWVREQGLDAKNLQKGTVSRLLEDPDLTAEQRTVLELRQELALVASKKYGTALGAVGDDGRLRGSFRYFGAHTGRWAGRGTQLQNLPREQLETEAETADAIEHLIRHREASAHTLKALVRAMFVGPFTVVDYASIEARVIAWLAGERWALEAFREGRDIYQDTASRMSTPTRTLDRSQGKVAVLALGYAGGVNALRAMGAEGSQEDLQMMVTQWRRANRAIGRLWENLGDAVAAPGRVGQHITVTTSRDALGRSVSVHLPSGRALTYHGMKWEKYVVPHPETGRPVHKEGWRYADPKNPFNSRQRIGTYSGKLSENLTQAVARDIMAAAIVRLRAEGYKVVGHVHDEILVEGRHDVEAIADIMTEIPDWAKGLPIGAAGFCTDRYRKEN